MQIQNIFYQCYIRRNNSFREHSGEEMFFLIERWQPSSTQHFNSFTHSDHIHSFSLLTMFSIFYFHITLRFQTVRKLTFYFQIVLLLYFPFPNSINHLSLFLIHSGVNFQVRTIKFSRKHCPSIDDSACGFLILYFHSKKNYIMSVMSSRSRQFQ